MIIYKNQDEYSSIWELQRKLNDEGIWFDTGSWVCEGNPSRDWELDWSFHYDPK